MTEQRRLFVRYGLAALFAITTFRSWAAWPKSAFDAKASKDALNTLYGGATAEPSELLRLVAPEIAENGTVVPVTVQSDLKDLESITLIAEENPRPLLGTFSFGKFASPPISVRIKMSKTQNVVAIAKAQGKLYSASKQIKVTVGGCGG